METSTSRQWEKRRQQYNRLLGIKETLKVNLRLRLFEQLVQALKPADPAARAVYRLLDLRPPQGRPDKNLCIRTALPVS